MIKLLLLLLQETITSVEGSSTISYVFFKKGVSKPSSSTNTNGCGLTRSASDSINTASMIKVLYSAGIYSSQYKLI